MGASVFIGRVGGLAVALGVGVAIATGQGVAWAIPAESNSTTSESSASSDASSGSAATSGSSTTASTESETTTSTSKSTSSPATSTVEPGEVVSTGGAQPDDPDDEGESAPATDAGAEAVSPDEPEETVPSAHRSKKRTTTDEVGVQRKSSAGAVNEAEASVNPVSAPESTVEMSTAGGVADKVAANESVITGSRSTVALEPQTLAAVESFTISQDVPRITMAASQPSTTQLTLPRLVTNLLSAFGFSGLSSSIPGAPAWSPLGLALLALGARRETEQTFSTRTTTADAPVAALALAPTAAVTAEPGTTRTPVAVSTNTDFIEFVTGAGNLNDTQRRFGIGGTDLGIMWDNGIPDDPTTAVNEHQVLIAFGDTFSNSYPVRSGIWRMNTLFRSSDTTLSNGLYVPDGIPHDPGKYSGSPMTDPNFSREILGHPAYAIGPEVTIIPTSAISVPGAGVNGATRQYISFMSVRSWDSPGRWTTNYSGIAYSDDNGQNWRAELVPASSIRTAAAGRSTVPYVSGNQNFQQAAFVKPPPGSPEAAEGWVYSYGTPAGRGGTVYLSRVNQYQILDQTKYQYWNGSTWVPNNPAAAKPILPGTTTSFFGFFKTTTYPSVGEMSVQYNPYLNKYVMLYADKNNNVVMRTSDTPQGTWSAPKTLVTSTTMPGLYAPMIHPWSGTTNVSETDRQYLYWNLSTWNDYEVRLMRTDLTKV
jgi:D-arabinan endo alpha-(1,5)-arabinofuranosidase